MTYSQRLRDDAMAIFLFHGVVPDCPYHVRNYTGKHVQQDDFARIISDLKQHGTPISLSDLITNERYEIPPGAFAITFDDGFANNLDVAAPILSDFQVPATFYVTTGFIDDNRMSWTDRLEYCLEHADAGQLSLPWDDRVFEFRTTADRVRLLDQIRWNVKRDNLLDVDDLVADIFRQCNVQEVSSGTDPLDQKLSWAQVKQLNDCPDFSVGGHTHTHAILSFLEPAELEDEISTSLQLLHERAGVSPDHYSYPEGLEHCYSDEVISALKDHGVRCCPTAEDGINFAGDSLFHLRRILVG